MGRDDADHEKLYRQNLTISPKYWGLHGPAIEAANLRWSWVHFKELNAHMKLKPDRADKPGLYLFVVKPVVQFEYMPSFVFYVGMSGEHGSDRPLRDRLCDYLRIDSIKKRDAVHRTLLMYYDHVWVAYASSGNSFGEIMKLEEALHGFFMPWAGKRDFPAKIKAARAAWG